MAIFVGTALKFAADVAIDRLKKKVKKPKRKSGKEMASSIVKREEKPKAIVKSISTTKLLSIKPVADVKPTKLSKESSGIVVIDDALDRIDSILLDCLQTIKASDKLKKKTLSEERKKQSKKQKKKRESILEKASSFIGGVGAKGINALRNTGILRWLNNVVLGSLVLFILNNWTFIVELFQKAWEQIKKIWEAFKPILETTWNALKWIVTAAGGGDLIRRGENLLRAMQGKPPIEGPTFDEPGVSDIDTLESSFSPDRSTQDPRKGNDGDYYKTIDKMGRGIWYAWNGEMERWIRLMVPALGVPGDSRESLQRYTKIPLKNQIEPPDWSKYKWNDELGQWEKLFDGGLVKGKEGKDKVPAMLTAGEYVIPKEKVDLYGVPFFNAIKSEKMSKFGLIQSLMTQASYEMIGGTTVVMITGNDSPPQDSGEGGIKLLPLPMVNSGDYTLAFRTGLQKFG